MGWWSRGRELDAVLTELDKRIAGLEWAQVRICMGCGQAAYKRDLIRVPGAEFATGYVTGTNVTETGQPLIGAWFHPRCVAGTAWERRKDTTNAGD